MRYIPSILLLSLFIFSGCIGEYRDHVRRESSIITNTGSLSGSIPDVRLTVLPDKNELLKLVETLDRAKDRIWIEIYTWTEKETLEAVLRAKKRGVDVRVILEGNVYRTPWINNQTVEKLKNAGILFSYANNRKYTFTHIKMWIIDSEWCVGTGNWSYSSFTSNRDFNICSSDKENMNNLEEIFLSDFRGERPYFPDGLDPSIGLSPENIRPWIGTHIQAAKKSIIIYNQSVSDPEIQSLLSQKAQSGVSVSICQSFQDDADEENIQTELSSLVESYTSKKPYLHAKVFLIDDEKVILGSANLTTNALDNNREILVDLSENPEIYKKIFLLYHKDCNVPYLK